MEQERITTDIPGITEQRENIGKDLEKSFEDRQIWEKNCKASELGQITAENNKNNCMLRAVESKFEVTKHRKDIIESTINSLNRKLMSLKDKMGNFHANIRELEHEKLAPANLQLPEYSNELDEEYDQLELGADGSLELFLLEQQQKDDQKTRSELEKSLDFSNHQKNKEDVRRLKKDQAIEAQLSKLHRKHEKRAEMLVELEEAQSRRIAVNDELKDIDLQLMKSKLAHLEKDETRVVELLSNEFGEVYGRLKDLCHCSDPDYEVTFKLAIKKYSEAILVDSSATALKCIQYLKDNCIPSEIFLPLKENELKEKNSSLEVLPNLQRQGIKLVKDVLVCDFPGIDVSKAVMYAAQKTLLCTDSATAAKASYNMSTRRNTVSLKILIYNTCLIPNFILFVVSGSYWHFESSLWYHYQIKYNNSLQGYRRFRS